jgi:hypothetical protein
MNDSDNIRGRSLGPEDFGMKRAVPDMENLPSIADILKEMPKPLGMTWSMKNMKRFLIARGYKIIKKMDYDIGKDIDIAIKEGMDLVPTSGNIVETFSNEIQNLIIELAIKLSNKL